MECNTMNHIIPPFSVWTKHKGTACCHIHRIFHNRLQTKKDETNALAIIFPNEGKPPGSFLSWGPPRGRPLGKRQMERETLSRWFLDSRRTIQYGGQDVEMSHAGKTHLHVAGVYFLVIFFPHLVSWFSKVNEMCRWRPRLVLLHSQVTHPNGYLLSQAFNSLSSEPPQSGNVTPDVAHLTAVVKGGPIQY